MLLAGQWDKYVTAFMDKQFAVDTLVALPAKAPYPFTALATVGFSVKAFGLKQMPIHSVELPPSSGPSTVDGF